MDGTISPSDVVLVTPGVVEAGAVVGAGAAVVSTESFKIPLPIPIRFHLLFLTTRIKILTIQ